MEHFLSYKKFFEGYDSFNIDDLTSENFNEIIDNITLYEGKLGLFKKLKIWSKSPKVKKLQNKANKERLKGIKEEVKIKKDTMDAISNGKDIDIDRIKSVLIAKRNATEKIASTYELEAGAIADGNEYLIKVIRVASAKGIIEQNTMKMQIADEEEKDALESVNNAAAKIIREDLFDIKQKMKDPSYQSPEAKDTTSTDDDDVEVDAEDLKNQDISDAKKMEILKRKWKNKPGDNHATKNFKRAQLRQELLIIQGKKVRGTKYDKAIDDVDKSSGVDVSKMGEDEIASWAKKEEEKKKNKSKNN